MSALVLEPRTGDTVSGRRSARVAEPRTGDTVCGRVAVCPPEPAGDGRAGVRHRDDGTALVEFVGLSVLLLLPLIYIMLGVFSVQRSAFAVTQAAREAGRAYATSDSAGNGAARARYAASLALRDQGLGREPTVWFAPDGASCGSGGGAGGGDGAASLAPGARFTVCVRTVAPLPLTGFGPLKGLADVTVNGKFTVVVDAFRAVRR